MRVLQGMEGRGQAGELLERIGRRDEVEVTVSSSAISRKLGRRARPSSDIPRDAPEATVITS